MYAYICMHIYLYSYIYIYIYSYISTTYTRPTHKNVVADNTKHTTNTKIHFQHTKMVQLILDFFERFQTFQNTFLSYIKIP